MSSPVIRCCLDDRWLLPGEPAFAPTSGVIATGEGWFETLRVEAGRPMFLAAHLERLQRSIARARDDAEALLAVEAARRCLSTMNAAFTDYPSGRLRLLLSRDEGRRVVGVGGWQALGEWSEHRSSPSSLEQGIDVVMASFQHPELGFLGKSASYHWSLAARQEAQMRGASEALLVRDGHIIEGATGALAWRRKGRWFVHESAAVLPSVTLAALRRTGIIFELSELPISALEPNAPQPLEGLVLISALRLAIAIRSCDGRLLPDATSTAVKWRDALLTEHAMDMTSVRT